MSIVGNFFFFFRILFLSYLYTQCGTRTHGPEVKSPMLYRLGQPGTLSIVWNFGMSVRAQANVHNHGWLGCIGLDHKDFEG